MWFIILLKAAMLKRRIGLLELFGAAWVESKMYTRNVMSKTAKIVISLVAVGWLGIILLYAGSSSRPLYFLNELFAKPTEQGLLGYHGFPLALVFSFVFPLIFVLSISWPLLMLLDRLNRKGVFKLPVSERWLLAFGFGTIRIGYLTLFLGWPLKFLNKPLFLVIYAFFVAGGVFYFFKNKLHEQLRDCFTSVFSKASFAYKMLGLFFVLAIGLLFVYASSPPIQSDGLRYHLSAPQEYIKAGAIEYLPYNTFTNFPFLPEMQFTFLMIGLPDISAKLLHGIVFLATMFGCCCFAKRFFGDTKTNWIAPFILLTTPVAYIIAGWEFTDHFIAFYFLMMLYAAAGAIAEGQKEEINVTNQLRWLFFAGVFGGATASTKYTMLPMVAVVVGLLFIILLKQNSGRKIAKISVGRLVFHFAVCGLTISVVFCPWLIKNVVNTGNPVYPAAYNKFGNENSEWTDEHQKGFAALAKRKGFHRHYDAALKDGNYGKAKLLILASIIDSALYYAQDPRVEVFGMGDWAGYEDQFQGLLYVLLLPLAFIVLFLKRREKSFSILLLLFAVYICFWLLWFHTYQSNRFLVPLFPVLAILFAVCVQALLERWQSFGKVCLGVILFLGVSQFLWSAHYFFVRAGERPMQAALGFVSRDAYLSHLNYYPMTRVIGKHVGDEDRILIVGDHRGYHFTDVHYFGNDFFDTPVIIHYMREQEGVDGLFARLRQDGISHVFVNYPEYSRQDKPFIVIQHRFKDWQWRQFGKFLQSRRLQKLTQPREGIVLYKIVEGE